MSFVQRHETVKYPSEHNERENPSPDSHTNSSRETRIDLRLRLGRVCRIPLSLNHEPALGASEPATTPTRNTTTAVTSWRGCCVSSHSRLVHPRSHSLTTTEFLVILFGLIWKKVSFSLFFEPSSLSTVRDQGRIEGFHRRELRDKERLKYTAHRCFQ